MNERPGRHAQHGVAVVLMLLVLLAAGSFYLLRALNAAERHRQSADEATRAALASARRALIGYAVRYPDQPGVANDAAGPGLLPCPDTRLDAGDVPGQADPPCARAAGTETGLLPWRTLDVAAARDGSGAPLWYALSDAFRNNPAGTVNSTTAADLRLDDCVTSGREIVALVIAPGPALPGQDRAGDPYAIGSYLEGENATRGDGCFASGGGPAGNDTVLAITREELMRAVERRVLRDVARALARYHRDPDGDDVAGRDPDCPSSVAVDCDDGFPWAAPFADPALGRFAGAVGVTAGHLPLRLPDADFDAAFHASWEIPAGGSFAASGDHPPSEDCVRNAGYCSFVPAGFSGPVTIAGGVSGEAGDGWAAGSCTWSASGGLACRTEVLVEDPVSGNRLRREYVIEARGVGYALAAPTATTRRLQHFAAGPGTLPAEASLRVVVTDSLLPPAGPGTLLGVGTLALAVGEALDRFTLGGIPFDLEIDTDGRIDPADARSPGELPAWFAANGWHELVAVAYAAAEAPGAEGECVAGVDCLVLDWQRPPPLPAVELDDLRGIALLAGPALPGQTRPSADPASYFEDANANLDGRFARRAADPAFNDRVQRLDPAE